MKTTISTSWTRVIIVVGPQRSKSGRGGMEINRLKEACHDQAI